MIVEATGKVMQVLSKIEGVSAKGHRECACNKYGQICKFYKKII